MHDTPRKGNLLLGTVFTRTHAGREGRERVPPFLLFDKPGTRRDVRFRGLLAPGSDRLSGEEDLVAVWRTTGGHRFQNYRARFTVLDVPSVSRAWISELASGQTTGPNCPDPWRAWVETGRDQGGRRPREGEGRPGEYHQRSSRPAIRPGQAIAWLVIP